MRILRNRWVWIAGVLVIALAAGAFLLYGGDGAEDDVTPAAEATDSVPDGGPAGDLVDQMAAEGVECEGFEAQDPEDETLIGFGKCFLRKDHVNETDIYVCADADVCKLWVRALKKPKGIDLLVGETWVISNASSDELKEIQSALGGEIINS